MKNTYPNDLTEVGDAFEKARDVLEGWARKKIAADTQQNLAVQDRSNKPDFGDVHEKTANQIAPRRRPTLVDLCSSQSRNSLVEPKISELIDDDEKIRRQIERLMRDALADKILPTHRYTQGGQVVRLADCEKWRPLSFGVSGIGSVPHPLTNPGPDTDGWPALLQISDFDNWLHVTNYMGDSHHKKPLAETKIDPFVQQYIYGNKSHSQDGLTKHADASPFKIPREKLRSAYKRLIGKSLKPGRPTKRQTLQK
ncbi:MAG: hypothetical protein WCB22_31195 [Pseudolabrys sp.]